MSVREHSHAYVSPRLAQIVERALVHGVALALPGHASVSGKSEPCEVFEQRRLELRTASRAIVILDAQQHAGIRTARARDVPHIDRVEHVAEMEIAGGSGSEPCDDRTSGIGDWGLGIRQFAYHCSILIPKPYLQFRFYTRVIRLPAFAALIRCSAARYASA